MKCFNLVFSPDKRRMTETANTDMLVIVDSMAKGLQFENSSVFILDHQEGYMELTIILQQRRLEVDNYKFLVLLIGRADLWESFKSFMSNVSKCLESLRTVNQHAVVVLSAALPCLRDDRRVINASGMRNHYLSQLAVEAPRLEFSKPGKHLIQFGKVDSKFFTEEGVLNARGLDSVSFALSAKFKCAKLRNLYIMLEASRKM